MAILLNETYNLTTALDLKGKAVTAKSEMDPPNAC
jgi:hypothetical protein